MKEITVDNETMAHIAIFEKTAHVDLLECVENEDMTLFIVGERKMAEMFRRNKDIIADLKDKINKHILVAEASKDLLTFVRNILFRYGVNEISITWKNNRTDIVVGVKQEEIGKVIGKDGKNIKLFKDAVSRYFNINTISVKQ
ncbi:MAG: NusA-like transcription termination signal-binding factor [Thermoplasmata archaeon]